MVIINICEKVVDASNKFERCNTELKRKYILDNIKLLNLIMSKVDGYCGSFGTGYPFYVLDSNLDGVSPYMPIHPLSLRKTWQYDDVAYNFVFDYLVSFTPFNFSKELNDKLEISRLKIRDNFSMEILIEFLYSVSSDVFKRRLETSEVKNNYEKRLLLWKK